MRSLTFSVSMTRREYNLRRTVNVAGVSLTDITEPDEPEYLRKRIKVCLEAESEEALKQYNLILAPKMVQAGLWTRHSLAGQIYGSRKDNEPALRRKSIRLAMGRSR